MDAIELRSNPLVWAQSRLVISPQRRWKIAVAYPLLVLGVATLVDRASGGMALSQLCTGVIGFMFGGQALFLGIVATSVLFKAVQRDYATGMIESHRLSGMAPTSIVLGYLFGPTSQSMLFALENFAIGGVASLLGGGTGIRSWVTLNLMIAIIALMLWTLNALAAISSGGKSNALGALFAFVFMGGTALLRFIPIFPVLFGGVLSAGGSVLGTGSGVAVGSRAGGVAVLIGVPAQFLLGLLCFIAAVRKVRRADVQAFDWRLGLALVALVDVLVVTGLWGVQSVTQIRLRPGRLLADTEDGNFILVQTVASQLLLTLAAFVPVSAAAQAEARWRRRRWYDPQDDERRPVPAWMVALIAAGLLFVPAIESSHVTQTKADAAMACGVLALGLVGMGGFMRWMYRGRDRVGLFATGYFFAAWIVPLILEGLWQAYFAPAEIHTRYTPLMGFSPFGATHAFVFGTNAPILIGVVVQACVAICLWFFALKWRPRAVAARAASAAAKG
ncbi:MAG: hypothetical protein U1A27_14785 [Phycisphaerae bacterium]